jgi:tRNA uridine 5-carboxymethylaminomethyl modification enzyme
MVDDLTHRGVAEPYRMFTSRAEFRLSLRADNADERLTPKAMALGMAGAGRMARFNAYRAEIAATRALAQDVTVTPNEAGRHGLAVNRDGVRRSAYDLLSYPGIDMAWLAGVDPRFGAVPARAAEALEIEAKYAVYLERQRSDVEQMRREESRPIPDALDFSTVAGLSNELRQKMRDRRPRSIADAQRMEGMTPAALALIVAHVRNMEPRKAGAA